MNPLPWIAATVVAGLIAGASWFAYGLGADSVRAEWAEERAEMQGEALAQSERYRVLEEKWRKSKQEASNARQVEAAAHSRMVLALAESDGLRREGPDYALGRAAADDSVDAARGRAAALGELLDEALRTGGESAAAAEQHAADVRLLSGSWPRSEVTP